jgi:hypothetical protein
MPALSNALRSREASNRNDLTRAEDWLAQAEAHAPDAYTWYTIAAQAARLNTLAPEESRARRAIADLSKAIDAQPVARAAIEQAPVLPSLARPRGF